MRRIGQQVDHRDVEAAALEGERHAHQHVVVEHAGTQDAVVAAERAGDVLGGLAPVEAHVGPGDVDRVAAQAHHRHLRRAAGAGRRLLEEQRHALAAQHLAQRVAGGQLEDPLEAVGPEVLHVEEAGHGVSPHP